MKLQSLFLAAALCLASVSFINAKSYDITISTPAMAGNVQLPAGLYHVKVSGDSAVFTMVDENKTFTAPVTLENGDQKYEDTAVVTSSKDGTDRIESIELGGSKTKLEFK